MSKFRFKLPVNLSLFERVSINGVAVDVNLEEHVMDFPAEGTSAKILIQFPVDNSILPMQLDVDLSTLTAGEDGIYDLKVFETFTEEWTSQPSNLRELEFAFFGPLVHRTTVHGQAFEFIDGIRTLYVVTPNEELFPGYTGEVRFTVTPTRGRSTSRRFVWEELDTKTKDTGFIHFITTQSYFRAQLRFFTPEGEEYKKGLQVTTEDHPDSTTPMDHREGTGYEIAMPLNWHKMSEGLKIEIVPDDRADQPLFGTGVYTLDYLALIGHQLTTFRRDIILETPAPAVNPDELPDNQTPTPYQVIISWNNPELAGGLLTSTKPDGSDEIHHTMGDTTYVSETSHHIQLSFDSMPSSAGKRIFKYEKEGFQTFVSEVEVLSDRGVIVEIGIREVIREVSLVVESDKTLTVNGTPYTETTSISVAEGTLLEITVSKPGYDSAIDSMLVSDGLVIDTSKYELMVSRHPHTFTLIYPDNGTKIPADAQFDLSGVSMEFGDSGKIETSFADNEAYTLEFSVEGFEPVKIDSTYRHGGDNVSEIILRRAKFTVEFRTTPQNAVVYVQEESGFRPLSNKQIFVEHGKTLTYYATADQFETSKHITSQPVTAHSVMDIQLNPVPCDLTIVTGSNSDLSGATITLHVGDIVTVINPDEVVKVPYDSEYHILIEQDKFIPRQILGVMDDTSKVHTIDDWKLASLTVTLPTDIVKPIIALDVTEPDSVPTTVNLTPGSKYDYMYGTTAKFSVVSANYETYTSIDYTLTEDVTVDTSLEMIRKRLTLEKRQLELFNVQLFSTEGRQVTAQITINGEDVSFEGVKKTFEFNHETNIEVRYTLEGYEDFTYSTVLVKNISLSGNVVRNGMKRKEYEVQLAFSVDGSPVSDIQNISINSEITGRVYSVDNLTIKNEAFTFDKIAINIDGYKRVLTELRFDEPSMELTVPLTKVVVKEVPAGKALIDTMSEEEINEWLDAIEPKFRLMDYYRHLRIGVAIRRYGFTVEGLKLFYKHFGKFCTHKYDFENYAELDKMFAINKD